MLSFCCGLESHKWNGLLSEVKPQLFCPIEIERREESGRSFATDELVPATITRSSGEELNMELQNNIDIAYREVTITEHNIEIVQQLSSK